jgi:uracil-DNA glycosylase
MPKPAHAPTLFDELESEPQSSESDATPVPPLPVSWLNVLRTEFTKPYYVDLWRFLAKERSLHQVFPPEQDVFSAFDESPYDRVRVLILGQDPYHDDNQAHGMCFSVRIGVPPPPSLKNIFRELTHDLGCEEPDNGYLVPWAKQGVLLLNSVLTVRAHQAASHQKKGWEPFIDAVIRAVNAKSEPVAFVHWGVHAQKKIDLIDESRHLVIKSAHPSPLSASNGFFGTRPFSKINDFLRREGFDEIDWRLPLRSDGRG